MALTITINQSLASELQLHAAANQLSVEEFATRVLAEAVAHRDLSEDEWSQKNQRRVELVRRSNRGTLNPQEQQELQQLQNELDQRLEHFDKNLFDQLQHMEKEAARLVNDG